MNEKQALCLLGFIFCVIGTVALVELNIVAAVFLLGLGLVIVGVVAGYTEKLFDMFKDILESIFK